MLNDIVQSKEIPSNYLEDISPVPVLPKSIKKRKKQSGEVLTKRNPKSKKNIEDYFSSSDQTKPLAVHIKEGKKSPSTSSKESEYCIECCENYYDTSNKADWLKCLGCGKWFHETCTIYGDNCVTCGREKLRAANLESAKKKVRL